jgi:malate permease and related proteins
VLTVLVLLLVGVAAGNLRLVPEGTGGLLDLLVIRLALPGLILAVVPELELGPGAAVPVLAAWGTLGFLAFAVWVWSRLAGFGATTTGALLLVVPLANTSFLGFPAVEALLGADHLPPAVVYDQLGSFLGLATYGAFIASRYGSGPRPRVADVVRRIVTFPPFVALVVALALRPVGIPGPLQEVAVQLGATVTPLAMLAVGIRLKLDRDGWQPGVMVGALGLRLVVAPALVLAAATAIGGTGPVWDASVLESAMPPMVIAGVLAAQADLDAALASRLVGVGVLASMVTLPAWALVLS